jgi:hypothetical protein
MLSEMTREVILTRDNAPGRQRGSGHSAVSEAVRRQEDMAGQRTWSNFLRFRVCEGGDGTPAGTRVRANCQGKGCMRASALASARTGRPSLRKMRAGPRSEPDSGNPTVRDRRGALGNVVHGGTVNLFGNRKGRVRNPPPTGTRAQLLSRHPHARLERRIQETGPIGHRA